MTGQQVQVPVRGWEPLLEGEARGHAEEVVEEVAEAIDARSWPDDDGSVAGGAAGFALLSGYLARATGDSEHEERALRQLDRAVELADSEMGASLCGGVAGVGWVAQHLSSLLEIEDADPEGDLERALVSVLERSGAQLAHELLYGLAGLAVYALERLPRPGAGTCLELVVGLLEQRAERGSAGATWYTPPETMPPHQVVEAPNGYYNLGVAHGVPGVLPPLAAAARVATGEARGLVEDAVGWLLAQRLDGKGGSVFPYWIAAGQEPKPARSAWCYGDPGLAAALLAAAGALAVEEWQSHALAIARLAAARPEEETGVIDAGLCHGAAGLGHIFNRVYQSTGDEDVREAAVAWFERALRMRSPGTGVAGYEAVLGRDPDADPRVDDPGLVTGAAGIGLALLAATTDLEPAWDRLLALSVRTQVE